MTIPLIAKLMLSTTMIVGTLVSTAESTHAATSSPESIWLQDLTVTKVIDGDTIQVLDDITSETTNVRLACVDAPERTQKPHGLASTNRLKALLPIGQSVSLKTDTKRDRYNRIAAEVFIPDALEPVNMQMVAEGQSTVYTQYLSSCPENADMYMQSENLARQQEIGVWSDPDFIMPSVFRHTCKLPSS